MSRKLDLSQFRGDDSDDDDSLAPKKQFELNQLKSKTFSHGITKKSKKDLEKEAEERKRIDEEKAAALVLAEYEGAFEGPSTNPFQMGAMRGSGLGRGMRAFGPTGFVQAGGPVRPVAMPPFAPPRAPTAMPPGPPKGPAAMGYTKLHRPLPPREPSPPRSAGAKKGKRAMDQFLEEIKMNQEVREHRLGMVAKLEGSSVSALAAMEADKGGRAFSDAESTNVFVGNLPPNITEESLGMFFAKKGPVGTVKIMWPRGDEDLTIGGTMSGPRRQKAGLQGFVCFMKRDAAQMAIDELDGLDWGGSVLRVGWSKAVAVPAKALFDIGTRAKRSPSPSARRSDRRDRGRVSSISPEPARRKRSRSRSESGTPRRSYSPSSSSSYSRSPSHSPPPKKLSARDKWLAKVAPDQEQFIKTVAQRVRDHGKAFEDTLREREEDNPKFQFLFNQDLPDYHLYRVSINSRHRIPTPPPEGFADEGYASLYSTDSAEDSEKERTAKGKMGKLAMKRFEAMLRAMSGKRVEIARAMEFAMKRAETADEIAEAICQSLMLDGTPVPRKIARLHLVSDILHNSASPLPNAWRYRLAFERRLTPVFAHLHGVYNSLNAYSGRISADVFQAQVGAVLEIWERWIVYTQDVNDGFRGLFAGTVSLGPNGKPIVPEIKEGQETVKSQALKDRSAESSFKSSGFKSSFKPITEISVPVNLDGAALTEDMEDLDGEAMDEDLDGEAMDGEAMDEKDTVEGSTVRPWMRI